MDLINDLGDFDEGPRWYAAWTRSRQEKSAAKILSELQIPHYLPLKRDLHVWSDRKKLVELPLFSGYVFVNMDLLTPSKLKVLKVPGIVELIGNRSGPVPIPDYQIESIRTVLSAECEYSLETSLKEGDHVRVVRGPLTGIQGTLLRVNSESRLLLSINMIRQSISVSVSAADVVVAGT